MSDAALEEHGDRSSRCGAGRAALSEPTAFVLEHPPGCGNEIAWIAEVVLEDRLGVAAVPVEVAASDVVVLRRGDRSLSMSSAFLRRASHAWLAPETCRVESDTIWDVAAAGLGDGLRHRTIPVHFGCAGFSMERRGHATLEVDLLGSIFFHLSRYEECCLPDRDEHGRFPGSASMAGRRGLLGRPLADELVEVLWNAMRRVWSDLRRPAAAGSIELSCDVDWIRDEASTRATASMRRALSLLRRGELGGAVETIRDHRRVRRHGDAADPHARGLEMLLRAAERLGTPGVFNFIPITTDPARDGDNRPGDPGMGDLLRAIHRRGHAIGVHPGYASFDNPSRIADSVATMRRTLAELGIEQSRLSSRQHFLRWCPKRTAAALDAAGVDVDSTLGYADLPGFRCGTSHEFRMYDCATRRPLRLRQRPLVAMECSFLSGSYLGLRPGKEMVSQLRELRRACLHYGGTFTLLWHNSLLSSPRLRRTLRQALDGFEASS